MQSHARVKVTEANPHTEGYGMESLTILTRSAKDTIVCSCLNLANSNSNTYVFSNSNNYVFSNSNNYVLAGSNTGPVQVL